VSETPAAPLSVIPAIPETEARAAEQVGGAASSLAWKENELLSENLSPDELAKQAQRAEHGRSQRFKNHFELMAIGALWLSAGAIAIIGAIWIAHMIFPAKWRWLTTEDISHLQSIATAGLLVGVIGNHFKKRLS
jgi:hypothetical protein